MASISAGIDTMICTKLTPRKERHWIGERRTLNTYLSSTISVQDDALSTSPFASRRGTHHSRGHAPGGYPFRNVNSIGGPSRSPCSSHSLGIEKGCDFMACSGLQSLRGRAKPCTRIPSEAHLILIPGAQSA